MKKKYPLVEFVIRKLVFKAGDDYVLHPNAEEGFKLALDELFRSDLDPGPQIEAVLKLGALFMSKRSDAGDAIARLLASDDRALNVLALSSARTRRSKERFQRMSGQAAQKSAPKYGEAAPQGSLKVKSFLQPGSEIRPRPRRALHQWTVHPSR